MKVNIDEIARRAGVSTATVSRALNGHNTVKEETRQKILSIAHELNYIPNHIARGLSTQKTETIGVILPELVDEFFMELIHGIDEEAYRQKYYILLSSSHSQRNIVETSLEFMTSGRVDGVILMAPQMQHELIDLVAKNKRPIVLLNCASDLEGITSFNIDNFGGAFAITQHLIDHGYKKISMITGPRGNCDAEERLKGFKMALKQSDVKLDEKYIIPGDFTIRSGYYGFNRLFTQPDKPEAIFAANDMMALGIYQAAKTMNLKIPEDIAVVGFDDIRLGQFVNPRLTTIHVPIQELGSRAVRYLIKMIRKEADSNSTYHEKLSTGLIIGGSCGCQVSQFNTII